MTDVYTVDPTQCPKCHSFAWSYDDNCIITDESGATADLDLCRCDDCDHTWLVPSIAIDIDPQLSDEFGDIDAPNGGPRD